MTRIPRWLAVAVILSVFACLLLGRGEAGGDKGPWQPILPKEVYQELAKCEADIIRKSLSGSPNQHVINRAKFGAVLIAALTMSVKGTPADELRGTRETALALAGALNMKDQATAKKLAESLPNAKSDQNMGTINWGSYLQQADLMDHFHVKDKGGDGIHPDLQSNIRLKGALNGVEEKIRNLALKEQTPANLKKEAKELELLAYRSAVVGSLATFYAPAMKQAKKDPQEWRTLSLRMRDNSVSLAAAAQKGDAPAILRASSDLSSTCTQCHNVFK